MTRTLCSYKVPSTPLRAADRLRWLSLALLIGCVLLIGSAAAAQEPTEQPPTPTRTPDPRATYWTPPPSPFAIGVQQVVRLTTLDFSVLGIGSVAADGEGNLYLGDGRQTILVLSPALQEVRRLTVPQPFALAITQRGELLVGQRIQATLSRYTLDGVLISRLWEQSEALLDAFTIAPNGDFYILWTRTNPPAITYLTRLNAAGQLVFTREFGKPRRTTDAVHGIAAAPNGELNVLLTGYDFSDMFSAAHLMLSAEGDLLLNRPPLPVLRPMQPPAVPLRLPSGAFVVHSNAYIYWWRAEGQLNASLFTDATRAGFASPILARRSALAAQPDGKTLYVVEVLNDGSLGVAVITLQQR